MSDYINRYACLLKVDEAASRRVIKGYYDGARRFVKASTVIAGQSSTAIEGSKANRSPFGPCQFMKGTHQSLGNRTRFAGANVSAI